MEFFLSGNCLEFPGQEPRAWSAAPMSACSPRVSWPEEFFMCWNSITFLSLRSLNHLFSALNQAVSLLASSGLEYFSLIGETVEPQESGGAQTGSTGTATVRVHLPSRLCHVQLLPCACTSSGNISTAFPEEGDFHTVSVSRRLWELLFFMHYPSQIWEIVFQEGSRAQ